MFLYRKLEYEPNSDFGELLIVVISYCAVIIIIWFLKLRKLKKWFLTLGCAHDSVGIDGCTTQQVSSYEYSGIYVDTFFLNGKAVLGFSVRN